MMKKTINKVAALGLALASVVALAAPAQAEVKLPNGLSFGSTIFADFTSYSNNATPVATNFDAVNGFHLGRAYIYLKDKIDDNMSARVTIDALNSTGAAPTVFLKHAYLDYSVNENVTIESGLGGTPWVPFVEKLWGYRSLGDTNGFVAGKVLSDKNGALSSADYGVSVLGAISGFNYQAGVYNGEGYNGVVNGAGYKMAARVGYDDASGFGIAAYYDTETKRKGAVAYDPTRTAAIVYYKQPMFTVAAEYMLASDFAANLPAASVAALTAAGAKFQDGNGYSVFATFKPMDTVRLFARYDGMTNNTRVVAPAVAVTATTLTAGATYILGKDQEVSIDYSIANNGVAPVSVTTNTLCVNLLTGF